MLHIFCNLKPVKYQFCDKFAFSKGDYEGLRNELQLIDWNDKLLPYSDNTDQMWQNFKCDLEKSIERFIPKVKNFTDFKKRFLDQTFKSIFTG